MNRWLLFLLVLLLPRLALADGLIVIHDPPTVVRGHFRFAPLEVSYHHVKVSIDTGVAVTHVDQEFYNPNPQRLEGTYLFPLPDGAHIDKFSMDIDGKMMDAELLPADKAKQIYEDIVRRQRDPALLEYVGKAAFKVRIFPIEPNSRKKVKLQYTQLLNSDSGLSEYVYPLNTEKFSSRPLNSVSVKVDLKTATPIKSVYCPSHSADIRRDGSGSAVAGWEARNVRPDTDFKLIWSQDKDPVGINLLTWQTGPDDGYFLLLASPGVDIDPKKVQPKDICFVLDTSGSMAGPKLEQARKAVNFCLANLNADDRFEIVRFSTEAEQLFGSPVPADKANVDKAYAFVSGLKPIGGTAIADALALAGKITPRKDTPYVVIFLTDGQPTIGETNEDKLLALIGDKAGGTRVFPFGIGSDINTHLLDRIAERTHAASQYVLPSEDIEVKVSSFYTKIKEPVLTNVKLEVTTSARRNPDGTTTQLSDVRINQLYPGTLPDLFRGDTLTIFGRYNGSGEARLQIRGSVDGEPAVFATAANFTRGDTKHAFIPRLWATRRVGWLLDEIRLRGESKELKDEIARLAREHGIVTPYTSYLILEDEQRRNVPIETRTFRELNDDGLAKQEAKRVYDSARRDTGQKAGEQAVTNAQAANQLRSGTSESDALIGAGMAKARPAAQPTAPGQPAAEEAQGYRIAQNYTQQARVIKGRAFYQNGTVWTDATAQQQGLKRQTIKFNSDDYFALLAKHPAAAAWLSLGEEVDLVIGDTLYNVR